MNLAEATRVEDILVPVQYGRDRYGEFGVFTGYETEELCFWCGADLDGPRYRRWCKAKPAHWRIYYQHFNWGYASSWCLERYDYRCANCDYHQIVPAGDHPSWYVQNLEVHHIVPLDGSWRLWSVLNIPWNLICLCHDCHQAVHAAMRALKSRRPSRAEVQIEKGQLVLAL